MPLVVNSNCLVLSIVGGSGSINNHVSNFRGNVDQDLPSRPATIPPNQTDDDTYFDLRVNRYHTVQVGETAYLACRVKNLGYRTVRPEFKSLC